MSAQDDDKQEKRGMFGWLGFGRKKDKPDAAPVTEAVEDERSPAAELETAEPEAADPKALEPAVSEPEGDPHALTAVTEAISAWPNELPSDGALDGWVPEGIVPALPEPEPIEKPSTTFESPSEATEASLAEDRSTDTPSPSAFGLTAEAPDTEESEKTDPVETEPTPEPEKKGFFSRLKAGLSRSTNAISGGITGIFTKAKLDDDTLEELEDLLISSDLGVDAAAQVTKDLAKNRFNKDISPREVRAELAAIIAQRLEPVAKAFHLRDDTKPHVILVVGVNGTGKTTTIGKLAHRFTQEGKSVMLAAGDTFRAAAIEQLKVWGERTGSPVLARDIGADAAGLAFDALKQAKDEGRDVLMIDTAGRLQNKQGLMEELAKVIRVLKKQDPDTPHSVLLVLDATTGQNAISQVEVFKDVAGVTGLVMTKLDGTARGGILVALADKFGLPIHAIGVGESIEDFQAFEADGFARALTGADEDEA